MTTCHSIAVCYSRQYAVTVAYGMKVCLKVLFRAVSYTVTHHTVTVTYGV